MESLHQTLTSFQNWQHQLSFPAAPANLYDAITYFLEGGGKKLHPVLCLLGNELFGELQTDAFHAATAIALYHNCSQVHDDINTHASLRRGRTSLHSRYNSNTALLAGDVLLIHAFSHLNKIRHKRVKSISTLFHQSALSVCEGVLLELERARMPLAATSYTDYLAIIDKKEAALMAASVGIGAMIGGAAPVQQADIADFGRQLGMAFQLQEDYLDAFGEPDQSDKQSGGGISGYRRTALQVRAMELCGSGGTDQMEQALQKTGAERSIALQDIFREYGLDKWIVGEIDQYTVRAFDRLESIDVPAIRKERLTALADMLLVRQH